MSAPDELPEDEMVSAVLDGEADDITRARVLEHPARTERLAAFGALRDELRSFSIPEVALEDARRAAITEAVGEPPEQRTAPVLALSAGRVRRARRSGLLGAAAAVVLLVLAAGIFGGGGNDRADQSTTAAFDTASGSTAARGDASQERAAAPAAAPAMSTGAIAAPSPTSNPPPDLGAVANLDALAAAYRSRARTPTSTIPTGGTGTGTAAPGTTCGPVTATATLEGRAVLLLPDGTRITVVDRSTCETLGAFSP